MSNKKSIIKNSFWLGFGEICKNIIKFIITILLVRYLLPVQYGELNFVNSLTATIGIMINLGLSVIMSRDLSVNGSEISKYLSNIVSLKLLLGFLYFVILIVIAAVYRDKHWTIILILSGLLFWFEDISSIFAAIFLAEERMEKIFVMILVHDVGFILAALITVYLSLNIEELLAGYVSAGAFTALVAHRMTKQSGVHWSLKFDKEFLVRILGQSFPLFGVVAISSIYLNVDKLMIGYFLGQDSVGFYQGAYNFLVVFLGANIVNLAIFPRLSVNINSDNRFGINQLHRVVGFFLVIALVPAALISCYFAKDGILIVYGEKMLPSLDVLRVLLWVGVINFLRVYISNILIAKQKQRYVFFAALAGLIINSILNYFFIPYFNISGAGFSLIVSEIAMVVILLLFQYRRNLIFPYTTLPSSQTGNEVIRIRGPI
jgi:O-antigen/teichoic acid export membrane protein